MCSTWSGKSWHPWCCCLTLELSGEPDEDPPHHNPPLHSLHQTKPRLQAPDFRKGGGRCSSRIWHRNVNKQRYYLWILAKQKALMDIWFQVIMQLEACGIVETIHISAAGFPIRSNLFLSSLKHCFFSDSNLSFNWLGFSVLQDCL